MTCLMTNSQPTQISTTTTEYENVTVEQFEADIRPLHRPAILKGLVKDWPAVTAASQSTEELIAYIKNFENGKMQCTLLGQPEIKGKFLYNANMDGFNFRRENETISTTLDRLKSYSTQDNPPSAFVQAVILGEILPGFSEQNSMPLLDQAIRPQAWIGNRLSVRTHFDLYDNIACLVAGKRRFTMFPPDQLANIYLGPFEITPGGSPISMVSLEHPDLEKYPKFADAIAAGEYADPEPGDGIYIPYGWLHHVRSYENLNMLINYWWNNQSGHISSPFGALIHALLAVRDLSEDQKIFWKNMFDNFVFRVNGNPMDHLPEENRGGFDHFSPEQGRQLIAKLAKSITPP